MRFSLLRVKAVSKKTQFVLVTFIAVFLLGFSSSPPIGNTGAPGDGNCGNCHGGGNFPGSIFFDWSTDPSPEFIIEFDTGVPNQFGYQMTILDDNDDPIGTYVDIPSNSSVKTSAGQEWLGHDPSTFINSGFFEVEGSWNPQGYTGDLTVYLAINAANGNGNTGGDDIHLFQFPQTIVSSGPTLSVTIIDFENPICNGLCTGQLVASPTGGQPPYEYDWSDGQSTNTANNLCADSYEVTVTDTNGDTAVASMDIEEPDPIEIFADIQEAGCFGENNGFINLTVTGGTPDYEYDWGPFGDDCCLSFLFAGTYGVTIIDDNGCDHSESFVVTENPEIILTTSSTMASSGVANGTATVEATGGAGDFDYDWSNGEDTSTITGLSPATYSVTVTDDEDCEEIATITVTGQVCNLSINVNTNNPNCYGENGTLVASAIDATPPVEYNWSDGTQGPTLIGPAGSYSVTATDAAGCSINSGAIILTQPDSLDVLLVSLTGASCAGGLDGALTVAVVGGDEDYTLTWENGLTNDTLINGLDTLINLPDTLFNLPVGYFNYELVDGNGCTKMDSFLIPNNDNIPPIITTQTLVVHLDEMGVAPPVQVEDLVETATDNCGIQEIFIVSAPSYSCADIGSSMLTINATDTNNNLVSVTALVTVIDTIAPQLICPQSFSVSTCAAIDYDLPVVTDNCDSGLSPILTAGLSAGSLFPAGSTTNTFEATDLCGNVGSCSFVISVQIDLDLDATSTPATCGLMDGIITLVASGGTPPYSFSPDLSTGVGAGTFTITVTDDGGCQAETTVVVEQVGGPSITGTESVTFCPNSEGVGRIEVTGGQAPYNVLIDGQAVNNDMGPLIDFGLSEEGTFSITLVDSNGCASNSIEVAATEIQIVQVSVPDVDIGCAASIPAGQVQLPPGNSIQGNPSSLTPGTFILIDDTCGLPSGTLTVTGGGMLTATATTTPSSCAGPSGSVTIQAMGGIEPYTFAPFGPEQGGLAAGNYSVTVRDATGCEFVVEFSIVQENGPSLTIEETTVCFESQDGELTLTGTGGTPPYTFSINSGPPMQGMSPFTFSDLPPGTYSLAIFDENGCSAQTIGVVREHPELIIQAEPDPGSDCILSPDELLVSPMGGVQPYDIMRTLQPDSSILVTVVDGVGCEVTAVFESNLLDPLEVSVFVDYVCIDNTPLVEFNVAGGCPPFETDFDQSINTQVGEHIITISDSSGQTTAVTLVIEDIGELAVIAPGTIVSDGATSIVIDTEIFGGIAPYEYQWSDASGLTISDQSDFNVQLDSSQVVTLTVIDNRGCSTTTEVSIEISSSTIDLDTSDNQVQVYPSPVADWLNINVTDPAPVEIHMMNMNGQVINRQRANSSSFRMDVFELDAGVYFLRMEFEDRIILKRFIKS